MFNLVSEFFFFTVLVKIYLSAKFILQIKFARTIISEDARSRLEENPMAKFFLSNVYFNEKDIEYLLDFPTTSGLSVSKLLSVELSNKHQVCSSHELAPLLQETFEIQKGFQKEKGTHSH
ncbi:hypothetical protein GLOIN_2v1774202 [Rhizophagus clarus]|uniref:Uncharacterized protein n=1 Tax=Rhizophagus clarus TaxID=94130 RepID=A0A8H3QVH1_9GLOM|nr:hypothetical protein GLOIN_2v1774202 [Rhizophagus clarus]